VIAARFDDLVPGSARSFRLAKPVRELAALAPAEVPRVLEEAEAEAARGRWVAGFVAYEAAPGLDPALTVRRHKRGASFEDLPLAWFGVFERREDVSPPGPPTAAADGPAWAPSVDRARYVAAVERIRELIARGETYQVNHTLRMRATLPATDRPGDGTSTPPTRPDENDADLDARYADLVLAQRGGFGADLRAGRFRILSASPELFFARRGARITTRPMKGTARRGRWPEEDVAAAARLRSSAKDRAENAMIVDLLRNDLGRIAVPGTVVADPLFDLERYETVWQMTSTVSAQIPRRTSLVQVFRALFPSGSVTGAPKVASMRAIAELEDAPRGVYTGAIGLLAPPGSGEPEAIFGVGIRTIQTDTATGACEYGVGAGITFGSDGNMEFDEVEAKARVLFERRPAFELFESLAWAPSQGYRHLDEHLRRLSGSAGYFGFVFDRASALEALEKATADAGAPARVRLTLARDGRVDIEIAPLRAPPSEPVRLAIVEEAPVDARDIWLFHKTTRRETYERRRDLRPGADDVLLVNTEGNVTESTIANLAVRIDGAWWTPPIGDGLLAGTYRAVLVRGGSLRERSLTAGDVRSAEALELISSVRGRRAAALVDTASVTPPRRGADTA
jgi:para-aminobenzoate synthetase / 4-amino-4-deoxychorismate lyase